MKFLCNYALLYKVKSFLYQVFSERFARFLLRLMHTNVIFENILFVYHCITKNIQHTNTLQCST